MDVAETLSRTWITRNGRGRYLASAELEPDWFPAFAAELDAANLLAAPLVARLEALAAEADAGGDHATAARIRAALWDTDDQEST